MHATRAYVAEFTNTCSWQEVTKEKNNSQVYVPAIGVGHRPLKRKSSIKGTFINKKKMKKSRANI